MHETYFVVVVVGINSSAVPAAEGTKKYGEISWASWEPSRGGMCLGDCIQRKSSTKGLALQVHIGWKICAVWNGICYFEDEKKLEKKLERVIMGGMDGWVEKEVFALDPNNYIDLMNKNWWNIVVSAMGLGEDLSV